VQCGTTVNQWTWSIPLPARQPFREAKLRIDPEAADSKAAGDLVSLIAEAMEAQRLVLASPDLSLNQLGKREGRCRTHLARLLRISWLRHFDSAPLIEDGSVKSDATTLVNLGGYWDIGRLTLGAEVFNAFNSKDADITYFYESRLAGEAVGVEDLHIHPVEPRQLRVSARYTF